MQLLLFFNFCTLLLLTAPASAAKNPSPAPQAKGTTQSQSGSKSSQASKQRRFGVVDMQQVILAVEEGKQARQKLEREIKAKEKLLTQSRTELEQLNKELQSQAALLSDAAKFKKQQKFQEKFLSLRNAEMEFQVEIKRKEQQATKEIAGKVAQLVERLAQQLKLTAVFETNSAGLLYVRNPVNLTERVIEAYDKKFAANEKKK